MLVCSYFEMITFATATSGFLKNILENYAVESQRQLQLDVGTLLLQSSLKTNCKTMKNAPQNEFGRKRLR